MTDEIMCEIHDGEENQDNCSHNEKSYAFSITLLVSFSYLSLAVYNYINTHAIDRVYYSVAILFLSSFVIIVLYLILYIFLSVLSTECQNNSVKSYTSLLFKLTVTVGLMLILYSVFESFILIFNIDSGALEFFAGLLILIGVPLLMNMFFENDYTSPWIISIVISIILFVELLVDIFPFWDFIALILFLLLLAALLIPIFIFVYYSHCIKSKKPFTIKSLKKTTQSYFSVAVVLIPVCLLSFMFLIPSILVVDSSPFLHGSVDIQMENSYSNNANPIHFTVVITGPVNDLSIKFSSIESDFTVNRLDDLIITENNHSSPVAISDKGLIVGNVAKQGHYEFFINSSELPTGYYKIECVRPEIRNSYVEKMFYYG